jgi:hypothetical protein
MRPAFVGIAGLSGSIVTTESSRFGRDWRADPRMNAAIRRAGCDGRGNPTGTAPRCPSWVGCRTAPARAKISPAAPEWIRRHALLKRPQASRTTVRSHFFEYRDRTETKQAGVAVAQLTSIVGRGSCPSRDGVRLAGSRILDLLASGELIFRGDADGLTSCLAPGDRGAMMTLDVEPLCLSDRPNDRRAG